MFPKLHFTDYQMYRKDFMNIFDFIVIILSIISGAYALPYGNYEYKRKNKTSAIIIYMTALVGITLSVLQCYIQK